MKKILIIDDEEDMLFLMSRLLEKRGFEVAIRSTGNKAVETVEKEHPDLILLDIKLDGDYDGREICKELKTNAATSKTVVFLCSAHIKMEDKPMGHYEDGFIPKPINLNEFIEKVNRSI